MPHYRITHPMADEISVIDHVMAHARKGMSSEIAFFLDGEWMCEPVEPFAEYHDGTNSDTATYGYVPNELIQDFLKEYNAVPRNR